MAPYITIVTACYNSQDTILQALESVAAQGYKSIEHIICDGGSTDGTLDIIYEFKKKQKYPIYLISEYDKGVYDALNKGVRKAKGELIGILHSNDFYCENAFDTITELFEKHDKTEGVYRGALRYWSSKGEKLGVQNVTENCTWEERDINHPAWFVHRKIHDHHGHYDKGFAIAADWDFYIRLLNNNVPFHSTEKEITNYRLGGLSSRKSPGIVLRKIRDDFRILKRNRIPLVQRWNFMFMNDLIKPFFKIITGKRKGKS